MCAVLPAIQPAVCQTHNRPPPHPHHPHPHTYAQPAARSPRVRTPTMPRQRTPLHDPRGAAAPGSWSDGTTWSPHLDRDAAAVGAVGGPAVGQPLQPRTPPNHRRSRSGLAREPSHSRLGSGGPAGPVTPSYEPSPGRRRPISSSSRESATANRERQLGNGSPPSW